MFLRTSPATAGYATGRFFFFCGLTKLSPESRPLQSLLPCQAPQALLHPEFWETQGDDMGRAQGWGRPAAAPGPQASQACLGGARCTSISKNVNIF